MSLEDVACNYESLCDHAERIHDLELKLVDLLKKVNDIEFKIDRIASRVRKK